MLDSMTTFILHVSIVFIRNPSWATLRKAREYRWREEAKLPTAPT